MRCEITDEIDHLFNEAADRFEEMRRNPVTGGDWINGIDPIAPQEKAAYLRLKARRWFARTGPNDAPPLPLSYEERESMKFGGLPRLVSWYARSLDAINYDYETHPSFEAYARGVLASRYAPDFIKQVEELQRQYPARELHGLGPGLVWRPDAHDRSRLRETQSGASPSGG